MFRNKEKIEYKEYIKTFGPAIVLVIIGFIITYQFVSPAPPKHLVIATGSPEGAYYTYISFLNPMDTFNKILFLQLSSGRINQ